MGTGHRDPVPGAGRLVLDGAGHGGLSSPTPSLSPHDSIQIYIKFRTISPTFYNLLPQVELRLRWDNRSAWMTPVALWHSEAVVSTSGSQRDDGDGDDEDGFLN